MTHKEFIAKYSGKEIDFDNAFGPQCMDLYRQYVKEVQGLPQSRPVVGAKDVWYTYLAKEYDRFYNAPKAVPQKGDIIIWSRMPGNRYGHIGVFDRGNVRNFISFDQNWPVGSSCHLQAHNYDNVRGWIRPKTKKSFNIRTMFESVWGTPAARGEELYFIKRIEKGSIEHTKKDILTKMQYWYGIVYPTGKYSVFGNILWQIEKAKVLLGG